jgi:hypothetical protein
VKNFACLRETKQEDILTAWYDCLTGHLVKIATYLQNTYYNSRRPVQPIPDTEWDDFLLALQTSVDVAILFNEPIYHQILVRLLFFASSYLGYLGNSRTQALQRIFNGLAVENQASSDTTHNFFLKLLDIAIGGSELENSVQRDKDYLPVRGVQFIARAAYNGNVSLDSSEQLDGALHVCARLLVDTHTARARKSVLRVIMKMLVEEGGAHWDATDATRTCTVVHHFDRSTVARYTNLQCLAARVVRRHVAGYQHELGHMLAAFVSLH